MNFRPCLYQTMIRDHILDVPRCAIWAGMGMGKITATLDAIDTLRLVDDAPVLVLSVRFLRRCKLKSQTRAHRV